MAKKVLVVLTSADKIVKLDKPTGWYLVREILQAELRPSAEIFPAEIVVASPKGGIAPLDPSSIDMFKSDESSILNNHKSVWEKTTPLKEFIGRSDEFDALFYPGGGGGGGHGPMYDLVTDQDSIKLIEDFYNAGKPVAAVCHGPIVFRDAKGKSGEPLLKGKNVTGFTNVEEDQVQLSAAMPFLPEDELKKVGANFQAADQPWGEKVVVDGLIISGQNPASARGVGEAIAKAIGV
ncbi:ThiJ/PfpI family protein [Metarhizium brunneum]